MGADMLVKGSPKYDHVGILIAFIFAIVFTNSVGAVPAQTYANSKNASVSNYTTNATTSVLAFPPWPPVPYRVKILDGRSPGILDFSVLGKDATLIEHETFLDFTSILSSIFESSEYTGWRNFVAVADEDIRAENQPFFFTLDLHNRQGPGSASLPLHAAQILDGISGQVTHFGLVEMMVDVEGYRDLTGYFQLLLEPPSSMPLLDPTFLLVSTSVNDFGLVEIERVGHIDDPSGLGYALTQVQIKISQLQFSLFKKLTLVVQGYRFEMETDQNIPPTFQAKFSKTFAVDLVRSIQTFELAYKGGMTFKVWYKKDAESRIIGHGSFTKVGASNNNTTISNAGNFTITQGGQRPADPLEIFS